LVLLLKIKCKSSFLLRNYIKNINHFLIGVPLRQLKKSDNLFRKQIISQIWAFLLLGLFVNALIIQALHHHDSQDQFTNYQSKIEKSHKGTDFHSSKISCKLCEMVKQQSHFYELPTPFRSILVLEESMELTFGYLPKHPVAYIQLAANKGPPSPLV